MPKLTFVPFNRLDAKEWDKLVVESPDSFVFALSSWRNVILNVPRWNLQDYSFAISDGQQLLGVMPLQYFPAQYVMASSGWGGSGPVVAKGLGLKQRRKVLSAILEHATSKAKECHASEFSFSLSPVTPTSISAPWGVHPYSEFGFEDASGITRILNLELAEETLWRMCSETSRQAIKRARTAGYTVALGDWKKEVTNYYSLHQETYIRTGVQPHPIEYFSGIAEHMSPSGNALLWVCRNKKGNAVAYHNSAVMPERGVYLTGCSASAALQDGVNYLLFWEALIALKQRGITWYECGEVFPHLHDSNDKRHGLTIFKTKFGGENHRYFKCHKNLSFPQNEIALPETTKQLFRNVLSSGKKLILHVGKRAKG